MKWFQGTADAVRQFIWVFEVGGQIHADGMDGQDQKQWFLLTLCFHAGCTKQEHRACADPVWRSVVQNELHGLCPGMLGPYSIGLVSLVHTRFS